MGWDTVDEHTARFFNWNVSVFIDLKVHHQRKTNYKSGYVKAGYINGKMLYSIRMDFFLICFENDNDTNSHDTDCNKKSNNSHISSKGRMNKQ